jgi:hypothetical protein
MGFTADLNKRLSAIAEFHKLTIRSHIDLEPEHATNSPTDQVEIGSISYRQKADRFDYQASQRAINDLARIVKQVLEKTEPKAFSPAQGISSDRNALEDLQKTYEALRYRYLKTDTEKFGQLIEILNEDAENKITKEDCREYREELEEQIRLNRVSLQTESNKQKPNKDDLNELNLNAIFLYNNLVKLSLKEALLIANLGQANFLKDRQIKSKLTKSFKSIINLTNELNFYKRRNISTKKIREIATKDLFGANISLANLQAYDIEKTDGVTQIRKGLWICPHRRIRSIINEYIRNREKNREQAQLTQAKLDELKAIYNSEDELFRNEKHQAIFKLLEDLQKTIKEGPNKDAKELRNDVKKIQNLLDAGEYEYIKRDIFYSSDKHAGTRSIMHTIEGQVEEIVKIEEKQLALVENINFQLRIIASTGTFNDSQKKQLEEDINNLIQMESKGQVVEKREIVKRLKESLNLIASAYKSRTSNEEEKQRYKQEIEKIAKIFCDASDLDHSSNFALKDQLQIEALPTIRSLYINRIKNLQNMQDAERKKLNALFKETMLEDLQGSAYEMVKLFEQGKKSEISALIKSLKNSYFSSEHTEPGLNRVDNYLQTIENILASDEDDAYKLEALDNYRDLIINDTEHVTSYRFTVLDLDHEKKTSAKIVYAPKNTSLQTLSSRNKPFIRDPQSRSMRERKNVANTALTDDNNEIYQISEEPGTNQAKFIVSRLMFDINLAFNEFNKVNDLKESLKELIERLNKIKRPSKGLLRIKKQLEKLIRARNISKEDAQRALQLINYDFNNRHKYRITLLDLDATKPYPRYVFVDSENDFFTGGHYFQQHGGQKNKFADDTKYYRSSNPIRNVGDKAKLFNRKIYIPKLV